MGGLTRLPQETSPCMEEEISKIEKEAVVDIQESSTLREIDDAKVKHLGRKSAINLFLRGLKKLDKKQIAQFGALANDVKKKLELELKKRKLELQEEEIEVKIKKEKVDITKPGKRIERGHLHPLTIVRRDIEKIFHFMGFYSVEGPEVETEWNNFDALNVPRQHPARDMHDTLWLKKEKDPEHSLLMRTHTSPMQIRYMKKHYPPFKLISPGRVFRHEATDVTHEMQFHQVEGLAVGKKISLAHLKGILQYFFSQFFKKDISVKFTSSYFPFTEPSVEVHLRCFKCRGEGCRICKKTGWIEVAGAGMVHQNVFKAVGYTSNQWQGFAFGMSIERLAMLRYGIDDIRLFFGSDLRFLKQF